MVKKEVAVYLYLGILIIAAFLAIYLFNIPFTGFAVFEQNSQVSFDEGTYENVFYDINTSSIILEENKTVGEYSSKIFDAAESTTWTNLTWTGTGSLEFEGRVCSDSTCSNGSFSSIDLNNINLTGQYFQYRVLFDNTTSNETLVLQTVSMNYAITIEPEPEVLDISILEPSGTKSETHGIPLEFEITGGTATACWYNLRDASDNALLTPEVVSLADCNGNTTFDVGTGEGDYILALFAQGSSGTYNETTTFSVSLPSSNDEEEEETETELETESTTQVSVQASQETQIITDLALQSIAKTTLNPSASSNFNLIANNIGDVRLSECILVAGGADASWLTVPEISQDIDAGETKNFAFSMNVPNNAAEGIHVFSLSVQCAEIIKNSEFSVEVLKEKIEFNITEVERTRKDRVVVSYSLKELLNETQTVGLDFFLYDTSNAEAGNASVNQTLSAGESDNFRTNIAINESLGENMTLTLTANLNSEKYSVSVKEPIVLGAPTGFFALGEDLGTTGNVLAIVILIAVVAGIFFLIKGNKFFKKSSKFQSPA